MRTAIACRPDPEAVERRALATDHDPGVRLALSVHPAPSEQERAGIDCAIPAGRAIHWWPVSPFPQDAHEVRRKADSAHPLLRREAARDRFLPPDLVERLAAEDDLAHPAAANPALAPETSERLVATRGAWG